MSKAQRGGPGQPKGIEKPRGSGRTKGALNKNTAEIKALAGRYGKEAIDKLAHLMRKGKDEDIQFRATQELLNRGFGRPQQAVNVGGHDGGPLDFNTMNLDQLVDLATRLERTLASQQASGSD